MADLEELAGRVDGLKKPDNALDVLIEVAMFRPEPGWRSCRANAAGTKVIYTDDDGRDHTHWAPPWTMVTKTAAAALRSRTQGNPNG